MTPLWFWDETAQPIWQIMLGLDLLIRAQVDAFIWAQTGPPCGRQKNGLIS